jgi:hypothetical protein
MMRPNAHIGLGDESHLGRYDQPEMGAFQFWGNLSNGALAE